MYGLILVGGLSYIIVTKVNTINQMVTIVEESKTVTIWQAVEMKL